jgi:hypothetical protein
LLAIDVPEEEIIKYEWVEEAEDLSRIPYPRSSREPLRSGKSSHRGGTRPDRRSALEALTGSENGLGQITVFEPCAASPHLASSHQ